MNKKDTIKWILKQFKAMGATWLQLKIEHVKMATDINHLHRNMRLLDL